MSDEREVLVRQTRELRIPLMGVLRNGMRDAGDDGVGKDLKTSYPDKAAFT